MEKKKIKDDPSLSNFLVKTTMKAQDFTKSKDLFLFVCPVEQACENPSLAY